MLSADAVSQIKAARGVYRASDVARAYDVHKSTIKRIWDGSVHGAVAPALDFPDLSVKYKPRDLTEDIAIYLERGMTPKEVANALDISERSVWRYKGVWM